MRKTKAQRHRDSLIKALLKRCDFTLECLPEDFAPEDSFDDPKDVEWARNEVANGNEWGWCCAHVIATIEIDGVFTDASHATAVTISGDDYLGGCSYESEDAFKKPGGYYDDMKLTACKALADKLLAAQTAITNLTKRGKRHA